MNRSLHENIPVWREGAATADSVAEEVPVELRFDGAPYVVMMCSPGELADFARGFCVTEGIVRDLSALGAVRVQEVEGGMVVDVALRAGAAANLAGRERWLEGRSGCGLCGARTLDDVVQPLARVPAGVTVREAAIRRVLTGLSRQQALNQITGAAHAAAWASADGLVLALREDVGRHNALDKLIGHLLASRTDLSQGFCVVTSRASFEMVQKAAVVGMPMLVAISAPTALAVRLAREAGMTLVGFARAGRHVVYSCPGRLHGEGGVA